MASRREFLVGGALSVLGAGALHGEALGLIPDAGTDQSEALASALQRTADEGRVLHLAAGRYRVAGVALPPGAQITGVAGQTILELTTGEVILQATGDGVRLLGLSFEGPGGTIDSPDGLVTFETCTDFAVTDCRFSGAPARGIGLYQSTGRLRDCRFRDCFAAAIGAHECAGLMIENNDIADCANLGIYVSRDAPGNDGSVIRGNRIARIDWALGGSGEVGNGVNLYRAGDVVVTDNVIEDCAFSAIRLNSTRDCVVSGNTCLRSGEVAMFSEFGFSGSVIEGNVIDDAATGISISNLDEGGRLATCSGNVVRNIRTHSDTNPDTTPVGIAVEAGTTVSGNVIDGVPGEAMLLGWGPYLSNVSATGNVISGATIGIGVSVVEGTGTVLVANNLIEASEGGIVGMEWDAITVPDLVAAAADYPNAKLSGNAITATPWSEPEPD